MVDSKDPPFPQHTLSRLTLSHIQIRSNDQSQIARIEESLLHLLTIRRFSDHHQIHLRHQSYVFDSCCVFHLHVRPVF
jgi:hypothetical protein